MRGVFDMADFDKSKPYSSWVAIDVAKDYNAVMIERSDGTRKKFRMANSADDHDKLVAFIRELPQPARIGFEATGNYHRALGFRLASEGFDTCLISSIAGARYREVMFNSWDKNDPKDAEVLLELLKKGIVQRHVEPLIAGHHDLQELSKTYYNVTLSRTRLQHSILNHYLPLYFPEMRKFWCSTRAQWWVNYLLRFPTPACVRRLPFEEYTTVAWPLLGRKVAKQRKLEELYAVAQRSIGLPIAPDSLACETFKLQLHRYLDLNAHRKALEERAHEILSQNPDYVVLTSIPGIGPITALTIFAEGGDLRRFGHHRQFLKYCGFDLAKNQSGSMRGLEQLSKRGNARLRLALWMAALNATTHKENSFREKFRRYIQSDPQNADLRRKALTAVAAKMARVVYGLIKSGKTYQGYFEQALPSGSIPLCRAVEAVRTS